MKEKPREYVCICTGRRYTLTESTPEEPQRYRKYVDGLPPTREVELFEYRQQLKQCMGLTSSGGLLH